MEILLTVLLSIVSFCLIWFLKSSRKKYANLPLGPRSLPIVGYIPFMGKEPYKVYKELADKYGNVFGLYLGSTYSIILNDYSSSKEALNNSSLLYRPTGMFDFVPDGAGFPGFNGAEWVEQRRYVMKSLKDVGMIKSPWESDLQAEVDDFLQIIESHRGQPVDLSGALSVSVSNNMTSIVLGKRLLMGDPRRKIVDEGARAVAQVFVMSAIVTYMPSLVPVLVKLGISVYAKEYPKVVAFNRFMRKEVETRKERFREQKEDIFLDDYLMEMQKSKEKSFYNQKNLIGNAQSIIIGGSETGTTALLWLFLAMAAFPEIQKKIYNEIHTQLGRDGKIRWMERSKLPYTYAAVMEALRWRTIAPINVPREAIEDTKLASYDVPKGSTVLINIWALHNDEKYWKDPETFEPNRFLQSDGTLIVFKPDSYIPFSMGRRNCPGEFVALIEIFQYFVAVLQRFEIHPMEGKKLNLVGSLQASTFQPVRQKLRYRPRE